MFVFPEKRKEKIMRKNERIVIVFSKVFGGDYNLGIWVLKYLQRRMFSICFQLLIFPRRCRGGTSIKRK